MQRREEPTYLDVNVGHEDGEIGEMSAGARGVRPVGAQQAAVLRRPVTGHGSLGVAPERTVGVEVLLRLLFEGKKIMKYTTKTCRWFHCHTAGGPTPVFHWVF